MAAKVCSTNTCWSLTDVKETVLLANGGSTDTMMGAVGLAGSYQASMGQKDNSIG